MLRRLAQATTPCLTALAISALSLATPAAAQMLYGQYDPNAESAGVKGPWARYQTHVLKLSANEYAVLFRPGWVHGPTAFHAISPICRARGLKTRLIGPVAPVDIVLEKGEDSVHQGYRVACVKAD